MGDELARVDGARPDESGHQPGQDVVGHAQQDEIRVDGHLGRRQHRDAGQQRLGTEPGEIRHRGDREDAVAGPLEGRPEHGADTPGAHHADAQSGWPGGAGGNRHAAHLTERRPH